MRFVQVLTLLLVLGLALGFAGYYGTHWWSSQGTYIHGPTYEGILMHSERQLSSARHEGWLMTRAEVNALEHVLPEYLAANSNRFAALARALPDYYRQYYVDQAWRDRIIRVEFYNHSAISRYAWLHHTPMLGGNSNQFWHLDYHLASHQFDNFGM